MGLRKLSQIGCTECQKLFIGFASRGQQSYVIQEPLLGQPADVAAVRTHNAVDDAVQSYTANSLLRRNGRSAAFGSRAVNSPEVSTLAICRRRLVELAFVFSCGAALCDGRIRRSTLVDRETLEIHGDGISSMRPAQ